MNDLLFLTHRLPYPPDKGDKIRSFHWLAHLSTRYRVFLGTFIDDPEDFAHREAVASYCADCCIRPLGRVRSTLGKLGAYATGLPLTLGHYADAVLEAWVEDVMRRHAIRRVLVFSSTMAQFLGAAAAEQCTVVTDLVDVDSEKWRQYAMRHRWPRSYLFRREARTLLDYEREVAKRSAAVLFVTPQERDLFASRVSGSIANAFAVENGVDVDFFSPEHVREDNPYDPGARALVFTGAMDYWANVDAVAWFAREIFPAVTRAVPNAQFYIVGARPSPAVRKLAELPGVHVTGRVPDVRPYVAHAAAAVAPLRVARGVQNKVLEAFSLGRPVVATTAALEGIDVPEPLQSLRADDAASFAEACVRALASPDPELGRRGREFVASRYRWEDKARAIEALVEEAHASRPAPSSEPGARSEGG